MTSRSRALWLAQAVLLVVVAVFVWRSLAGRWEEFRSVQLPHQLRAGWILLAAGIVFATYGVLVAAWRAVIVGWGQRLGYRTALRIWTVSNLGRYVPGKVWSIAGLAVLAQREGVAGWAAVGAAIAMQAIAVGSGLAVAAATVPSTLSMGGTLVAGGVAAATVAALMVPGAVRSIGGLVRRPDLRVLPLGAVVVAGAASVLSWVSYGLAFWCLARGTLGPTPLALAPATGVFAAGYLAGLLALFAPGGVGVREAVLVPLLAPAVGSGGAVVLGLASRVLLTLTELVAALLGLVPGRGRAVRDERPAGGPDG